MNTNAASPPTVSSLALFDDVRLAPLACTVARVLLRECPDRVEQMPPLARAKLYAAAVCPERTLQRIHDTTADDGAQECLLCSAALAHFDLLPDPTTSEDMTHAAHDRDPNQPLPRFLRHYTRVQRRCPGAQWRLQQHAIRVQQQLLDMLLDDAGS